MLKKIACISIVILLVGALSLPCFAFEVPTYDENTSQLIYYISGQDDLFYVKDKNSYFFYNPTLSYQTVRITLTNYFVYYSRFYIITSYSWVNNDSCTIQFSSKFSDTTTYTFTDAIGGDYQSDFVSFIGSINPDGSDNVDFDSFEVFADITINPGKVCAFQFSWNRAPQPNDEGPGYDSAALMDETGLMAYTAALYDISNGLFSFGDGLAGSDFDFFNLFNLLGGFTYDQGKDDGYEIGFSEGQADYKAKYFHQIFDDGYLAGYQSGYDSGDFDGWARGYQDGINTRFEDPEGEISSLAQAYDKGVSDGIKAAKENGAINTELYNLIPNIFGSIFDSVVSFFDSLSPKITAFGVDLSTVVYTVFAIGIGFCVFTFLVKAVG